MAKSAAQREYDEADRAFRKAWKLLDRIEQRLEEARAVERKRLRQLGDSSGPDAAHRAAQLEAARAEIVGIERLLTELSDLIARHARMTTGQTVQDVAMSVAAEIKDEAAEPPTLSTTRRNRHHRPRRRPADGDGQTAAADDVGAGQPEVDADAEPEPDHGDGDADEEVIELAGPTATRRNRHHRPRRRPAEATGAEVAAADSTSAEPVATPESEPVAANEPAERADEVATDDDLGQEHIDPEPAPAERVSGSSFEPASISTAETDGGSGSEPDEALVDALLAGTPGHSTEASPVIETREPGLARAPVGAAARVADDPIIELPSSGPPEPPEIPEPTASPESQEPGDRVEPSETSEHAQRGGPAEA